MEMGHKSTHFQGKIPSSQRKMLNPPPLTHKKKKHITNKFYTVWAMLQTGRVTGNKVLFGVMSCRHAIIIVWNTFLCLFVSIFSSYFIYNTHHDILHQTCHDVQFKEDTNCVNYLTGRTTPWMFGLQPAWENFLFSYYFDGITTKTPESCPVDPMNDMDRYALYKWR